jgi:hypothetical protein
VQKEMTFVIDEKGDMLFLVTEAIEGSMFAREADIRRASHVEPANWALRVLFHILRRFLGDKGRMSDFTRRWNCLWRVNTKPMGGPVLTWSHVYSTKQMRSMARTECGITFPELFSIATWRDRRDAIDTEIEFLNQWFTR